MHKGLQVNELVMMCCWAELQTLWVPTFSVLLLQLYLPNTANLLLYLLLCLLSLPQHLFLKTWQHQHFLHLFFLFFFAAVLRSHIWPETFLRMFRCTLSPLIRNACVSGLMWWMVHVWYILLTGNPSLLPSWLQLCSCHQQTDLIWSKLRCAPRFLFYK